MKPPIDYDADNPFITVYGNGAYVGDMVVPTHRVGPPQDEHVWFRVVDGPDKGKSFRSPREHFAHVSPEVLDAAPHIFEILRK